MKTAPGVIRDAIVDYLGATNAEASINEIIKAVAIRLGEHPSPSSVRSYLNINTPKIFERVSRGKYRLMKETFVKEEKADYSLNKPASLKVGGAHIFNEDCFEWLARQESSSIHAVVTDPPYGLVEYSKKETEKMRAGKGGVWRIPPSFDGHVRSPLPRFTTLTESDRKALYAFFSEFGALVFRAVVPGANIIVASNPLLSHIVASAMSNSGLELRGYISRQVMTMRGGDRPKNAHQEFKDISVMPRSQWEPWIVLRKPIEGRVQDNLRKWRTGGFRRPCEDRPFGDVIRSNPTPANERKIAPHPSLKPQAFMRQLVRAVLPLGEGVVLDPFMGAGSTLAAANAIGYDSVGVELDGYFFEVAKDSITSLSALRVKELEPALF